MQEFKPKTISSIIEKLECSPFSKFLCLKYAARCLKKIIWGQILISKNGINFSVDTKFYNW